jgi:hypothetical protein
MHRVGQTGVQHDDDGRSGHVAGEAASYLEAMIDKYAT